MRVVLIKCEDLPSFGSVNMGIPYSSVSKIDALKCIEGTLPHLKVFFLCDPPVLAFL